MGKLVLLSCEIGVSLNSLFALNTDTQTGETEPLIHAPPQYVRLIQPSEWIAISSSDKNCVCVMKYAQLAHMVQAILNMRS